MGDGMSDDVGDVGVEGYCNDDDGYGDGSYGDDGGTMTLIKLSKIEYPRLKKMCHDSA